MNWYQTFDILFFQISVFHTIKKSSLVLVFFNNLRKLKNDSKSAKNEGAMKEFEYMQGSTFDET